MDNSAFSWLVTVFDPSSGGAARVPPVAHVLAWTDGHVPLVVHVRVWMNARVLLDVHVRAWVDARAQLVVRVRVWMVFPDDLPLVRICRADTRNEARIRCRMYSLSREQFRHVRTCRRQDLSVGPEDISCRRAVSAHSGRSSD